MKEQLLSRMGGGGGCEGVMKGITTAMHGAACCTTKSLVSLKGPLNPVDLSSRSPIYVTYNFSIGRHHRGGSM
jgi:hypothetical protein